MTRQRITVRGENLPEPFDGWDEDEYSTGEEAVYYPTDWRFKDGGRVLYLRWEDPDDRSERWITLDTIDSVDATHENRGSASDE